MVYHIGYDIGSSSVKAALVEPITGEVLAQSQSPMVEMEIISLANGWAEQHPEVWWEHLVKATHQLLTNSDINIDDIKGIGIAYQMHGLVIVDRNHDVIRPAIIWCDSRAIEIGEKAKEEIGYETALSHFLNFPGNFTASKLKWIQQNEPEHYKRVFKAMLPGDFIAMKMTGEIKTTPSGLSEAILWDFKTNQPAEIAFDYFGFAPDIIPDLTDTFGAQGTLTSEASKELGLSSKTVVSYRAGDQPNNAMSLGVLSPGEVAATAGTSGVIYGVTDKITYDPQSRVNNFAHVNHGIHQNRIGVLLCINGAGILYSWMKNQIGEDGITFNKMEQLANEVPINSEGLSVIPFGNGAERMFLNKNIGGSILNLQFNRHKKEHLFRATLEGIAYAFVHGFEIMNELGVKTNKIRVGNDNLFQSMIFSQTISSLTGATIQVINTSGAIGSAKASAYGLGEDDKSLENVFTNDDVVAIYQPQEHNVYLEGYSAWKSSLNKMV